MKLIFNIRTFTKGTAITIPVIVVLFLINACSGNSISSSEIGEENVLPAVKTTDAIILISDSGLMRFRATSPLWLVYADKSNPYWHFPKGLKFVRVDTLDHIESSVVADSAYYYEQAELWKLMGNVDIMNMAGDNFKTQLLFWDGKRDQIYSDSFIHIKRTDRVMEGYGFISNSQMTSYVIRKPSGVFPVDNKPDSTSVTDSTQIPSPQTDPQ